MSKKYELIEESAILLASGRTLRRIRALVAIASLGVVPGDVGGYVESEANLSQVYGDAWVYGDARVYGDAWVSGDARVYGDAQVSGNARVYGNAWVYGDAWVSGDARVYGDAQVYGDAWVYGNAQVSGACKQTPICISGLSWHVTITDNQMTIGCQSHAQADWAAFDDTRIASMDGKNALRFWRQHGAYLLSLRPATS